MCNTSSCWELFTVPYTYKFLFDYDGDADSDPSPRSQQKHWTSSQRK